MSKRWEEHQKRVEEFGGMGWAKVEPGQSVGEVLSIHVGPVPDRKSIALYILEQGVQYPLAYFRSDASATVFMNILNEFFLDKNEEAKNDEG